MSFPRYPKYKDSGVAWLGEVPEHWTAKPIKHLGRLKGGAGFPHDEQGVEGAELSFHKVNALGQARGDGRLLPSENTITRGTARQLGAFVFPQHSIVFAKVGAALLLGRIRLLSHEACIDNNMMGLVLRHDAFSVAFVRYAMDLVRFDFIANPGAVPSLNEGQIGDFRLALPPLPEQIAIAAFLDRETAKIDALVEEQRRLMELLKEKRQAVISHAVTKGLNPHAPMKPSGIEWLGDVPTHWAVTPIGHLCDHLSYGFTNPMPTTEDGPYMLTANDVDYGKIGYETARRTSFDAYLNDVTEKSRPRKGDVLVTKDGTLGRVAIHEGQDACINQSVASLRVKADSVRPEFMATCLLAGLYQSRMIYDAGGTTIKHIYISRLAKMPIAYPPISEQSEVLVFLDKEPARLDALTAEAQRAIDLLHERRTALISAAVTGQIDVRGIAETAAA